MSLGWQTESALLPSKAKPIAVDAKSVRGEIVFHSRDDVSKVSLLLYDFNSISLDDGAESSRVRAGAAAC
jgi:hypothetical protein